ncbi:beta-lactamase [Aneurinibacillus migulanus]|uniref:MBL fold metallo-hydrolase n=1 Tax=Aneurinibacillus migulanus TaxID=47500 RepID=UPI0005BB7D29|nr:MBL fold metallo-hydrolase [Aneurinibacillus migulanus]KIV57320.1 beta-lactamase [Aneurinibacillus migulanus]KPD08651.1 beta-lactamase [Aneurinibacillus migulanus]MCP1358822.1 MBL fold metallo-hydrolase [Aneurinibacillus migulanus]
MSISPIHFFQRTFPSANMILLHGKQPILVDTGFGSDISETEELLREARVKPENLSLIVNTHYHSDHVGGNYTFQTNYRIPIAAHCWEGEVINSRDQEACSAEWLDQPVEPYRVNRMLSDGDELDAGGVPVQVIHTPGHTLGHISLYAPDQQTLIVGDLFHQNDVGWINLFREGSGALQRSLISLDRLAALPICRAYSGHGPAIDDPVASIDNARRRLEKWLHTPEKVAWHGCKRIFAYALMILDGIPEEKIHEYLMTCGWFHDFSRHAFKTEPHRFVEPLLEEMIRSGAAVRADDGRLIAGAPYTSPGSEWSPTLPLPKQWPGVANTSSLL